VRTCVIFNPTAKGDKARRFRAHLDQIAAESSFKLTASVGDARRLAAEAVREGFEIVVAAGGDGTVNEVINGIGDVPTGFDRTRFGVLPLGTVNVFARELAIPNSFQDAWTTIRAGHETLIDVACAIFRKNGETDGRLFVQLAGAGLDARAIELVNWELKKKIGPLAYVWAGLHALTGPTARITVSNGNQSLEGGLVLIGNGRLYGGDYHVFPGADMHDGVLEACVFPKVDWWRLTQCGPSLLLRGRLPQHTFQILRGGCLELAGEGQIPFEVDGEFVGHLPATISVDRARLRVITPAV